MPLRRLADAKYCLAACKPIAAIGNSSINTTSRPLFDKASPPDIATAKITGPLKWHGGKYYLAEWIISQMPPHVHYVEPYFGGGAVLLHKRPMGVSEVVNDIHGELTTFWRVLQDDTTFQVFRRRVEAIPMSESQWSVAVNSDPSASTDVDRAVRFFVRIRQSRQGLGNAFATLSRNRTRRGMNEQASSWLSAVEGLPDVHTRLKRVVILNRDAIDVIRQQDGLNTLFYCDPPYLHETRTATKVYDHEMTVDEHRALLEALAEIKGSFVLSGYPHEVYASYASKYQWRCETIEIDNKASNASTKGTETECLWMNYPRD